ncbi:MAG: type II toxin-antitoxin system VapC family toxin [Gemmataceae bacterium]|nr:type II toxin-antitoxin system VapC family toxin [Gemmataceae bacterium]
MRLYLLDTGIANLYANFDPKVRARARAEKARGNRLGTSAPAAGELYAGAEGSATRAANLALVRQALRELTVWPYQRAEAEEFGRLAALLKRIGRTVGDVDVQTAAIARALGNCTVVTMDSDFSRVPGLPIEDWSV